jgi:hypothetical protein
VSTPPNGGVSRRCVSVPSSATPISHERTRRSTPELASTAWRITSVTNAYLATIERRWVIRPSPKKILHDRFASVQVTANPTRRKADLRKRTSRHFRRAPAKAGGCPRTSTATTTDSTDQAAETRKLQWKTQNSVPILVEDCSRVFPVLPGNARRTMDRLCRCPPCE